MVNMIVAILKEINVYDCIPASDNKYSIKNYCKKAKKGIESVYSKIFFNNLTANTGKLIVYQQIKHVYRMEKYLLMINHPNHRKAVSRIRLSAHKFPVEYGRQTGTERQDRKCTLCNSNKVGDEIHILLECENDTLKNYGSNTLLKQEVPVLPSTNPPASFVTRLIKPN